MPFNLGVSELVVILLIVLVVFGARRLPEIGASMGKGIKEFKRSITEVKNTIESDESLPPEGHVNSRAEEREPKKLSD